MERAKRSKTRHEEYLMERIPKLTTYEGFTANKPEQQPQQLETQNAQEPQTSETQKLQLTLENYMRVGEVTRNKREHRKKS